MNTVEPPYDHNFGPTTPVDPVERFRALRGLGMGGAVLHLGAHPDDEDCGLIAYLCRGRAVRTVYWSATRGEGGQNHVGAERGESLGVLRTWEALAARRVDGGDVLYGTFFDFGYSKSGEHALQRWGRDAVVREVASAIRIVQPQVVVSRWAGTTDDGHGQHEAIGLVAEEAFRRAADPNFPGLDLPVWAASKLYHSLEGDWQPGETVQSFQAINEGEVPGRLRIDLGGYDPGTGRTFHELSCLARNHHRSQAMAVLPRRGHFYVDYQLDATCAPAVAHEVDIFDGLDPTLAGLAAHAREPTGPLHGQLRRVCEGVAEAVASYAPHRPSDAVGTLLSARQELERALLMVTEGGTCAPGAARALAGYLTRRLGAFDAVIASCLGISVDATLDRPRVTAGDTVSVKTRVWNLGPADAHVADVTLDVPDGWELRSATEIDIGGADGAVAAMEHEIVVSATTEMSCPYWLRRPREPYRYVVPEGEPVGAAFDPSPLAAACTVEVAGSTIRLQTPALHCEPAQGELPQRVLSVLPPVGLRPRRRVRLVPSGPAPLDIAIDVEARRLSDSTTAGHLTIDAPAGWNVMPAHVDLDFTEGAEADTARFVLGVPSGAQGGKYDVTVVYTAEQRRGRDSISRAGTQCRSVVDIASAPHEALAAGVYPAEVAVIAPATVEIHLVPVQFVDGLRYGVVRGPEDETAAVLDGFGVDVTELSDEDLAYVDLGAFDTIVVGPNAYTARAAVRRSAQRLLDYVHRGGTLIVQQQGYAYQDLHATPYPLRFNQPHDRVTIPEAAVAPLRPDHVLLHLPNRIGPHDWEGWVHDRGKYFAGHWDPRYVPILTANDPGESPKEGGLLVTSYGYGMFAYVAYSLYRQLPAGVPGAVRLFANLLGLAEARIRERMRVARGVPLLASMSDTQLHDIARVVAERWFHDGTPLWHEGEQGDELVMVHEGEVAVERGGTVLHVAGPGEALGELAVLADVPRSATLRARGDVKVLVMRGRDFRRLLDDHPEIGRVLIRTLATRLAGAAEGA